MIHAYYPNDVDYNLEGVNPGATGSLVPGGGDHTILGIEIEHNQLTPAKVQCDQYGEGNWETVIEVSKDWHAPVYFRCHTGSVRYLSGTGGKHDVVLIYYLNYIDASTTEKPLAVGTSTVAGSMISSIGGTLSGNVNLVGVATLASAALLLVALFLKVRGKLYQKRFSSVSS